MMFLMETSSALKEAAAQQTVSRLIAAHAYTTPASKAVLSPGRESLTYEGLARQIAATAQALAAGGWGAGSRIGLALPNGPEMAVALVAIMSCATCVPLNPNTDEETLRFLLQRLGVDAVIVPESGSTVVRKVASELALGIIPLSFSPHDPAGTFTLDCKTGRAPVTATLAGAEDIALVLHTSGTTGRSKAVPLTHRSQLDSALQRAEWFGLTPRDRSLCVAPPFTATAIRRTLLPPLAAGGSIVCPREFVAEQMLDLLTEFEPTFYAAGPAIHRAVLEAIVRRGSAPRHALRFVISGSTALPAELQADLEDALGVALIQTYAMTETGSITQNPLPPAMRRPGSAGIPDKCELAIVGAGGEFLPAGESGEIMVRGPQVFSGYEDDPEANRNAFLDDWFRTGDLGFIDSDGYLYVTGRLKELINRGGFKVSPAEVDVVLMRNPAVAEAATFGIPHPTLGEDVVAAVVLRESAAVTPQALRDFALDNLAGFKVPSRIVMVTRIPKSPLGKVRRSELVDILGESLQPAYHAPRDPREEIVAELFADVLGIEAPGRFDNFFALGGDSLRSAQVTNRVNAVFNCRLDSVSLFRRPTVAEFAAEITSVLRDSQLSVQPPIVALPRGNVVARDDDRQVEA